MAAKQQDSLSYLEFAKRAFAPTARFNELRRSQHRAEHPFPLRSGR